MWLEKQNHTNVIGKTQPDTTRVPGYTNKTSNSTMQLFLFKLIKAKCKKSYNAICSLSQLDNITKFDEIWTSKSSIRAHLQEAFGIQFDRTRTNTEKHWNLLTKDPSCLSAMLFLQHGFTKNWVQIFFLCKQGMLDPIFWILRKLYSLL